MSYGLGNNIDIDMSFPVGGSVTNAIRAFCRKSTGTTCISPKIRSYDTKSYVSEGGEGHAYFNEEIGQTEVCEHVIITYLT